MSKINFITKYRDEFYIKRNHILNDYAEQTKIKGQMYYVYSENFKLENGYNLCICEKEKSDIVIVEILSNLPENVKVGSVLRKINEKYILDLESTKEIKLKLEALKEKILKNQNEFLNSKRIENHIYEVSEIGSDRVWLFDITEKMNFSEEIEEINFPKDLLENAREGDLYIYINGKYEKK